MSEAYPIADPERLLAQTEWVRRLARRMVLDPGRAEDLAQDTLLAALRQPPRGIGSTHSLRAWLTRVLRNRASLESRSEANRRERERSFAKEESEGSTAEVVERAETHRLVVEAVMELAEPYRRVVLLRYFDGLSTPNIAEKLGVSQEAVRKRLSRAVAMLRARVEERGGGQAGFVAALVTLANGAQDTALSAQTAIGFGLGAKLISGAAALALVIFGLVVLYQEEGSVSDVSVPVIAVVASSLEPAHVTGGTLPAVAGLGKREAIPLVASQGGPRLRVVTRENAEALGGATIHAALFPERTELGEEVRAQMEQLGIRDRFERWLGLAGEEAVPADPFSASRDPFAPRAGKLLATLEADGSIALETLRACLGEGAGLIAQHEGCISVFVPAVWLFGGEEQDKTLELPVSGTLSVLVRDRRTSEPVAGAYARIEASIAAAQEFAPRALFDTLAWRGPSDAKGRLELAGLPAESKAYVTLLGEFSRKPREVWIPRSGQGGPEEIDIWRVGSITGRIERAGGGPVSGLNARFERTWATTPRNILAVPAEEGRFFLEDVVAGRGTLSILAPFDGGGWMATALFERSLDVRPGETLDVGVLTVPGLETLAGRVTTEHEWSRFGAQILVWRAGRLVLRTGTSADGHFACELPPGEYELVFLHGGGWRQPEFARVRATCPSNSVHVDADRKLGGLRARLPDGFPDGSAFLRLLEQMPYDDGEWSLGGAIECGGEVIGQVFRASLLPPGLYDLELSFDGLASIRLEGISVEAGEVTDLGALELSAGSLRGIVTNIEGAPVEGARVLLVAPALAWTATSRDPVRREVSTDEFGRYRLRMLDARRWAVRAVALDGSMSEVLKVATPGGPEIVQDLKLLPAPYVVGRVTRAGAPARGVEITWGYGGFRDVKLSNNTPHSARTDEQGEYRLGPYVPGRYTFLCKENLEALRDVRLSAGQELRVDFELDQGLHVLELTDDGEPLMYLGSVLGSCIEGDSPYQSREYRGRLLGAGRVEIALPPALVALRINRTLRGGDAYFCMFLDGAKLGPSETIALPTGSLELELAPQLWNAERPKLRLLGIQGADLPRAWSIGVELASEILPGGIRFLDIPDGARCLLFGRDCEGADLEREFIFRGTGAQRMQWP